MKAKHLTAFALAGLMTASIVNTGCSTSSENETSTGTASAADMQALAEEAYIYAFPILMSYKTMYQYSVEPGTPNYKAPFNELKNTARVYGPQDTTVITANSDTPYSLLWSDLRAEPIVLTIPGIEAKRYFVAQTQDLSTYLLPYIGSRTTGNKGGTYMITGPDWKGGKPEGIDMMIPSETDFAFTVYRTQLFNPGDLDSVKKIQAGYKVQTLSSYLGKPAPAAAPKLDFPDWGDQKEPGNDFIGYLNFCLQYITPDAEDKAMWEKLAPIGVGAGKVFDYAKLPADQQATIAKGVKAASKQIIDATPQYADAITGQTRENYKHNWLYRAVVTKMGWGANDPHEASYPLLQVDGDDNKLDASQHNYTMTFAKGKLPPVKAFWSLTMYDGKTQLMINNPINRYLLNSPMLPDMQMGADGSLTLYIQKDSPGKELEANWLPAPNGPFYVLLRLYWPEEAFLNKSWKAPAVQIVK